MNIFYFICIYQYFSCPKTNYLGGRTAIKKIMTRETTPLTKFRTSDVHVKKAGNS